MRGIEDDRSIKVGSVEEALEVYNNNVDMTREIFNKLIAASNRQNRRIFILSIIGLGIAASVYGLTNRCMQMEERLNNYISRNAETEEK